MTVPACHQALADGGTENGPNLPPDNRPAFSVVLTTYARDDPDELDSAIDSVLDQTVPPDEVLVVEDGPVPDAIDDVLRRHRSVHPETVAVERLPQNRGQGPARQHGIERVSHGVVGLMDADDIAVRNRFERQLDFLVTHPEVDVVGSHLAEFDEDFRDPHSVRKVPTFPEEITRWGRRRNPMNQTTVMGRRDAFLDVGYRDVLRMEDYDLWGRMLASGKTLANIPEALVLARAGEMYERRGGLEYAREEFRLQREFMRIGYIGPLRAGLNLTFRVPVRFLPNQVRAWIYKRFLRSTK